MLSVWLSVLALWLSPRGAGVLAPGAVGARSAVAPRASFDIDFSAVEDEEDEEETKPTAIAREALMEKARESLPTIANMTVAELKTELRNLGQRMTGRKSDLVERLTNVRRKMAHGLPSSESEVHRDTEPHWYLLQTANGFEGTVERTLRQAISVQRLETEIDRIFVPIREGESSVRDASVMPSYILLHMRMSRELHTFVTGMQYVVNFVGFDRGGRTLAGNLDGTRGFVWPRPLSPEQFEDIVRLTKEPQEEARTPAQKVGLRQGDRVQVISGPFKGMQGKVVEVGAEELCTILLKVMGRETNVQVPVRHCSPVDSDMATGRRVDMDADDFERDRAFSVAEEDDEVDEEDDFGFGDLENDMEANMSDRMEEPIDNWDDGWNDEWKDDEENDAEEDPDEAWVEGDVEVSRTDVDA